MLRVVMKMIITRGVTGDDGVADAEDFADDVDGDEDGCIC